MRRDEARDWALALDIVWYRDRAAGFVNGMDAEGFRTSDIHRYAVERCVSVVGEAAAKLSDGFRSSLPDIPWHAVIGMRHVVVHDYGRVDLDRLWETVTIAMPRLASRLRPLIPPDETP